ncbi:hypothetical protein CQW23_04522 [Capsicum baccatum]|uniref:Late embryogenesis abundant protein LEA-2 subgroup domain-containing protein n=1 Tax=Capsicum baccatum TaxID=33114 RepID=A0A2G2XEV8_CAPBA|nr:hypothetical protein CQW23_04522 [Capsicum baccatum]
MNPFGFQFAAILLLLLNTVMVLETQAANVKPQRITCYKRYSKCYLKYITCPSECPQIRPKDPYAKECFLDCYSPKCEAVCRKRKPNCDGPGAACYDPRFIGGDGIVFYFHGKKDEHFSLISDVTVQINARFIGLRPAGRTRDFTWIQALGLMFGSHNFTLEATKAENWNQEVDHLKCTYDGMSFRVPIGHSSVWSSPDRNLELERTSATNSVRVTIQEIVEISANVVPVTEKEDAIHSYGIPKNDSFAHLEVQFRFFDLSPKVEGILGRTYQPSFKNSAKAGVDMAVVGGDNKYKTSSLLSADCNSCSVFTPGKMVAGRALPMDFGSLDCTGGNGIVCKK